jgi:hypothetical protein
MYDELLDDPKVQRLSGDDFKGWVNLLCLMSRGSPNLSTENDIAFALRLDPRKAKAMLSRLIEGGLIVKTDQGFEPHKWGARQYKSDVSTDRVKRFRERSKTVTETPPDTDTDTDVPVTNVTGADAPDSDKAFWDSAKAYLGKAKAAHIGKWVKDYGRGRTAAAIAQSQAERAVDPIPYIEVILRKPALQAVGGEGW